jgi:F-type H+-transporting ATPase subunit delta
MSRVTHAKVAKRYARALFNAAQKTGKTDAVRRDLAIFETLWSQVPDLRRALESPLVPAEKKRSIIDQAFSKEVNSLSRQFLHLLVDKRREEILPVVGEEFVQLSDAARNLVRAYATVASPLDDLQRAAMVESLERRTGKTVDLQVMVDAEVIGGAVIRLQDTVIDGSVRGTLERIREEMLRDR